MRYLPVLILLTQAAFAQKNEKIALQKFNVYFDAWNRYEFRSAAYRDFLNDTTTVWHGSKAGPGTLSVYNPFSSWKQWDVIMNGRYTVDSTIYIDSENKVVTRFRETTDFLEAIGVTAGLSATVHYWLDEDFRVREILYQWDSDNPDFEAQMAPVVEWAMEVDSTEIAELYLNHGFEPSWLNGIRWRRLLDSYRMDTQ